MKNKDILRAHDNNYTTLPTQSSEEPLVSVVLHCFNVSASLPKVLDGINKQTYQNIEIIIVDDGSTENIRQYIDRSSHRTRYIKHSFRQDRSAARNTGLAYAIGECTLILDPDIVLNIISIEKLVEAYKKYGNNIYVGFREDISINELLSRLSNSIEADYKKDIRYRYNYTPRVPILSIFGQEKKTRVIRILDETRLLKDFPAERVIGSWDLSAIITGHTMFMHTATAIAIGGFDEKYIGWGFDDIAFGAKMLTEGYKVIPVTESVGFHIAHPPHSISEEQKWKEFFENRNRYFSWLNQEHQKMKFNFKRKIELIEDVIHK